MLAGVKFVPRDQLLKHESDSDTSGKVKDKSRKKKSRRRDDSSIDDDKKERSERRKTKKKKKKKSKKRYSSDDASSDSSETDSESRRSKKRTESSSSELGSEKENFAARKEMGMEWMLKSGSRDSIREGIESETQPQLEAVEEMSKKNPKELNPYFKDNGCGYPDDASVLDSGNHLLSSSSSVGDGGASWRLKALKRAKEQAAREGRKLDSVVEERWGSLGKLAASVATHRAAPAHAHLHAIKDRKRGQTGKPETVASTEVKGDTEGVHFGGRDYLRDVSSRHPEMRKPRQDYSSWRKNKDPKAASEEQALISEAMSSVNKFANDGSFLEGISRHRSSTAGASDNSLHSNAEANEHEAVKLEPLKIRKINEPGTSKQVYSANQLSAKILQLRMKGKHEEAEKLSKEMEAIVEEQDGQRETAQSSNRYIRKQVASDLKKREEDADIHLAQKIIQNKRFSISGRADDEYDFDEAPGRKQNRKRDGVAKEKRNIPRRTMTQQEHCLFCFENPSRPKHLVVSIGNFTYMMIPQWKPVVQGHCCILTMQHDPATRTVDKNVWEEIRNFKKCLLRMFAEQEKDVLFIETVLGLGKRSKHCLIECIPVSSDLAKEAPMYFKKAIDEAEGEWGQHEMKRVIPTSGNLRHVIPEDLSYFHVEFGLDRGFVHVIDNDSNFKDGFGLNVVRGMLQLPEEDMHRKRRTEPVERQKQAVSSFAKEWDPFDWTKGLDHA